VVLDDEDRLRWSGYRHCAIMAVSVSRPRAKTTAQLARVSSPSLECMSLHAIAGDG